VKRIDLYLMPSELEGVSLDSRQVAVVDVLRSCTSIATALEGKVRLEVNPPIPETKFIDASGKSFNTIPPTDVSFFDVINAAFDAFVKAGGYTTRAYWSADGLNWKQSHNITEPDTNCSEESSYPQQPRVCVSWYEAEAYANRIIPEAKGEAERIRIRLLFIPSAQSGRIGKLLSSRCCCWCFH
jgi:hypothetical protein